MTGSTAFQKATMILAFPKKANMGLAFHKKGYDRSGTLYTFAIVDKLIDKEFINQ